MQNEYNKILKRFENIVTPEFSFEEFDGRGYYKVYKWKCCKCGNVFEDYYYSHTPRCLKCNPLIHGFSKKEIELLNFIKEFFPGAHKDKKLIRPFELDILIEDIKLAIEFNGRYYHSVQAGTVQNYHLNKTLACNQKGYRLIHIWEDEWNLNKESIKEKLIKIFKGEEDLLFEDDVITLDRSWFNGIEIPNYSLKEEIEPILVKRKSFEVENCGFLVYERI